MYFCNSTLAIKSTSIHRTDAFFKQINLRGMIVLTSMELSQFAPIGPCFKMKWWIWVTQMIIVWWFSLPWARWLFCEFCDQSEARMGMVCCSSCTFLSWFLCSVGLLQLHLWLFTHNFRSGCNYKFLFDVRKSSNHGACKQKALFVFWCSQGFLFCSYNMHISELCRQLLSINVNYGSRSFHSP